MAPLREKAKSLLYFETELGMKSVSDRSRRGSLAPLGFPRPGPRSLSRRGRHLRGRYIPFVLLSSARDDISLFRSKRPSPPIRPISRRGFPVARLSHPLHAMSVYPIGAYGGWSLLLFGSFHGFHAIVPVHHRSRFLPHHTHGLGSQAFANTEWVGHQRTVAWYPTGPFPDPKRVVWVPTLFPQQHPKRMPSFHRPTIHPSRPHLSCNGGSGSGPFLPSW